MLITGTNKKQIGELREKANAHFGEGQWTPSVDSFLGINCYHNIVAGTFSMDVAAKIAQLLTDYELDDLNGIDVPYATELVNLLMHLNITMNQRRSILQLSERILQVCVVHVFIAPPQGASFSNPSPRGRAQGCKRAFVHAFLIPAKLFRPVAPRGV